MIQELLKPLKSRLSWLKEVIEWERPVATVIVLAVSLIITYKYVLSGLFVCTKYPNHTFQ